MTEQGETGQEVKNSLFENNFIDTTLVSSGFANSFWTNSVPQIVRSTFVSASIHTTAKVATISMPSR